MACPDCPGAVPVVSQAMASAIVVQMTKEHKDRAALLSLQWLTKRDPLLSLYEGIMGRAYTNFEKDLIAIEVGVVSHLSCPFHDAKERGQCALGPAVQYALSHDPGSAPFGWLPTMLLRLIDPVQFRALVKAREIADAKVSMLTRKRALDPFEGTQEQPSEPSLVT